VQKTQKVVRASGRSIGFIGDEMFDLMVRAGNSNTLERTQAVA